MKKIIQGILLLLLFIYAVSSFAEEIKVAGFVPKFGFPKTEANPRSYAGYTPDPREDMGTIGAPASGPHYKDNGDGTIIDNATGLMWVKDPSLCGGSSYPNTWATALGIPAKMTWADAIANCEALSYAGHTDWRLPNIAELQSIVDHGRWLPAIDTSFFTCFNFDASAPAYWYRSCYWSSTSLIFNEPRDAWHICFRDGLTAGGWGRKSALCPVRPVRGGEGS